MFNSLSQRNKKNCRFSPLSVKHWFCDLLWNLLVDDQNSCWLVTCWTWGGGGGGVQRRRLCNTFLLCSLTVFQKGFFFSAAYWKGGGGGGGGRQRPWIWDYDWTILSLKKILHTCSSTVTIVYLCVTRLCYSCACSYLYCAFLTIIRTHNLKGKLCTILCWIHYITALLYYPKCYFLFNPIFLFVLLS